MVQASMKQSAVFVNDPSLSRDELLARVQDPRCAIVNVMPRAAFDDGHIPNSLNLPVAEIESRARAVLPDLEQEIVIYCASPT